MGRKANLLLTNTLLGVATIAAALFAFGAKLASIIEPSSNWLLSIISLGLTPLLFVNLICIIYWGIKKNLLALLPVVAILLNISYITAIVQVRFSTTTSENTVKVATYNVHNFKQYGDKQKTAKAISQFFNNENVDIVCFQEFIDDKKYTAEMIAKDFSFLPYQTQIQYNSAGLIVTIFSKFPIKQQNAIEFKGSNNNYMWADLDINGKTLRVVNAHLQTTNVNQSWKEISVITNNTISDEGKKAIDTVANRLTNNNIKRVAQSKSLTRIIEQTKSPIIVCGDFNDTPASYSYNFVKRAGLKDGFKAAGRGYMYTYRPLFKLLRIDYVFYSEDSIEPIDYYSPNVSTSDHKPVIFEFKLK